MQNKINHSLKIIADAVDKYGDKIAVASSFGKDSIVTLHLCLRVNPQMKVFSVMTPYKFQETRKYKKHIEDKWNLNIRTFERPLIANKNGSKNLYEEDPDKCCDYYKVQPSKQAIRELDVDAWISGLRNTEGHSRAFLDEIEVKDGLVKLNPILKWTEADVWLYHCANNIIPNPLYMRGYRSLGCEPCSKPYTETERGGRWQGTKKAAGECGIHTKSLVSQKEMPKLDVYGVPKRDTGKF